jgi:hypothetical protein
MGTGLALGLGIPFRRMGGSNYTPRVQAFLTATGITDQTIITALVNLDASLTANSALEGSIIALPPAVGGTATTNKYNFMDVSLYEIVFGGGVTHNSSGFTFNGTNGYAQHTGLNLNTLSISEGGASYYAGTYTDNGGNSYGVRNGSTLFQCFPNLSALNRTYFYVLDATDSFVSNSDQSGFFGIHREGGVKHRNIRGTTGTASVAAITPAPNELFNWGCVAFEGIGRFNFSNLPFKGGAIFNDNITAALMEDWRIILNQFQTDLGRAN